MEKNLHIKSGFRFGMNVILHEVESDWYRGKRKRVFLCKCDCGGIRKIRKATIANNTPVSCGCAFGIDKHGWAGTNYYASWSEMIRRCENESHQAYPDYGRRGISVCPRWRESFSNFLEDMGERPKGAMLERKNNDGDYCPENCIWATRIQQARNKRNNVTLTVNGETRCISEWEDIMGFTRTTIWQRITKLKWSHERAVLTPQKRRFHRLTK